LGRGPGGRWGGGGKGGRLDDTPRARHPAFCRAAVVTERWMGFGCDKRAAPFFGLQPSPLSRLHYRTFVRFCQGRKTREKELQHSPTLRPVDDLPVWSIVCFYTERACRRQGMTGALIKGAVKYAAAHGAPAVEAYPIAAWSEKVGPGDAYTGMASTFRELGFEEVRVSGSRSRGQRRIIMRYDLRRSLS
jgi:GNAT superfamily N-acetyltransferase